MLSLKALALLEKLTEISEVDKFLVKEDSEICSLFAPEIVTADELGTFFEELNDSGDVVVKFSNGNERCFAVTEKAVKTLAKTKQQQTSNLRDNDVSKTKETDNDVQIVTKSGKIKTEKRTLKTFFASFFGTVAGSLFIFGVWAFVFWIGSL